VSCAPSTLPWRCSVSRVPKQRCRGRSASGSCRNTIGPGVCVGRCRRPSTRRGRPAGHPGCHIFHREVELIFVAIVGAAKRRRCHGRSHVQHESQRAATHLPLPITTVAASSTHSSHWRRHPIADTCWRSDSPPGDRSRTGILRWDRVRLRPNRAAAFERVSRSSLSW
jgi:hypothetical protein